MTNPICYAIDDRRDLMIVDPKLMTSVCAQHFVETGRQAIANHGYFACALSGGSTPKGVFKLLASSEYNPLLDWSKVFLFWSDERAVPPTDSDSNYKMAMEAGFAHLPIPENQIFRMVAEVDVESNAAAYEDLIRTHIPKGRFDLVILGMGDDGHTASLFPRTHGLHPNDSLVIANYLPEKHVWRMTLTFECINEASSIVVYVCGKEKARVLKRVLNGIFEPDDLPAQRLGTQERHALWIVDSDAASELKIQNV